MILIRKSEKFSEVYSPIIRFTTFRIKRESFAEPAKYSRTLWSILYFKLTC